ncbi:hypothetical protein WH52_02505 [Tenacibaculum holothuriorum]|uniref:Gliding motility-associated C-terminal domain-containing protein n=1 Tax=Tenacibaculum holothuriorum TaxID=1635173 RepID=A0A1Y2PGA2_9FLAO|nr:gliding motility-associated C-terminal domain-containing protein [Tenacibaculum holothuriorum]OSY89523.1 hypothetical protein WH52_02505 [Tenacibaculum holothuriorum]
MKTYILKKYSLLLYVLLAFSPSILQAQISNTGTMHIISNTDVSMLNDVINTTSGTITNNGNLHLHRSLTNNGVINYSDGIQTGVTLFKGVTQQNIEGSGTTWFYNVVVTNPDTDASVSLQKEIQIYGTANFTDGVIQELGNGLAVFQKGANHSNTSDASFVDGKVHKVGNEAFVFPIGDENSGTFLYRMAAISAPSNANTIFSGEYIWENPDNTYSHANKEETIVNINANEYWIIEPTNNNDFADVTLSWNVQTTPNTLMTDTSRLIIVRWNGTEWIDEGGVVNTATNTITTRPSGYGVFTLAHKLNTVNTVGFPNSFSPNGDGINDTFVIPNLAVQYPNFIMTIYNRYGNVVYKLENNGSKSPAWWDGKSNGRLNVFESEVVPAATYWYVIDFNDGKRKPIQKWLYLNK